MNRGKDWRGTVTGFQPPGALDFHHTIAVTQLRATVDVHIHYSFEPENASIRVSRWLVLDISMPAIVRPLRRLIISSFDKENLRTMAAVKKYAEAYAGHAPGDSSQSKNQNQPCLPGDGPGASQRGHESSHRARRSQLSACGYPRGHALCHVRH